MTCKNQRNVKKAPLPERHFTRFEEGMHAVTHGLGALLGIFALILLCIKSADDTYALFSSIIYGISLIFLYAASGSFHATGIFYRDGKTSRFREFTMKCDHSLIYFLILGTYTPACISAMRNTAGYIVFSIVGACCLLGAILNIINVDRFLKISLILYVVSGWTIGAALYPYYLAVGAGGILYLLLGGVAYTVGIFFYKARHKIYMHTVWHLFVLLGSILHFFMVYLYCI